MNFLIVLSLAYLVAGVDKRNFKTCSQASFCQRNRNLSRSSYNLAYEIWPASIGKIPGGIRFEVRSVHEEFTFISGEAALYSSGIFHFLLDENRYRVPLHDVVNTDYLEPSTAEIMIDDNRAVWNFNNRRFELHFSPLKLYCYHNGREVLVANGRQLMNFERNRDKDTSLPLKVDATTLFNNNLWEEKFRRFSDSKPLGPMSVGLDFTFDGPVYGIPEHTDSLRLADTLKGDPYRLYNLDVFEYELNSRASLYGAVPFVMSSTAGLFWNNPSETWIDVDRSKNSTHWFSETGVIDFYVLLEDEPMKISEKFTMLTGPPTLPPLWSLGYHQSRWNYFSQEELLEVLEGFDKHNLPLDVLWLDIEHTLDRKYFTWNYYKFNDPLDMLNQIEGTGRKLVNIVDPHMKASSSYNLHVDCMVDGWRPPDSCEEYKGNYVKDKNGDDFKGDCWPGASSWPDYTRPEVRMWWAEQFKYSKYKDTTKVVHIWNDMNEPSVFSGPEVTMPKDNRHGPYEHRDLHNIYGTYMMRATYEGLLLRDEGRQRPFVLSRAFYATTQKYGAVWTGDNAANWDHLVKSVPMLLSLNIAGLSFSGADVGGFFPDPGTSLLVKWYQLAIFYPFMRAHAHIDSIKREPWLFGNEVLEQIRFSLRERYQMLPYLYTLFYQYSQFGTPVLRPLFLEFPNDPACEEIDYQFMFGNALMGVAVSTESSISVYIPEGVWFDYHTWEKKNNGWIIDNVNDNWIPVYMRGGTIIPRQDTSRQSSVFMKDDPYTLVVALDNNQSARGLIYSDDGISFDYKEGAFLIGKVSFDKDVLVYQLEHPMEMANPINKIIILGMSEAITVATDDAGTVIEMLRQDSAVIIEQLRDVTVGKTWKISFHEAFLNSSD